MKQVLLSGVLASALVMWTGTALAEAPSFDPDQPFNQTFSSQMLRTLLNKALDILEDHIEVGGDLSPADSTKDQSGRLQLRIYPKGKSRSDEHLKAEGSFRFSPDSGQHDLHFRFQQPQESSRPAAPSPEGLL
jgi:hypothetical protein